MQTTLSPAKRSHYPLTVVLVLLVHLGLGYLVYQQLTQAKTSANGTELITIEQQESPAIP